MKMEDVINYLNQNPAYFATATAVAGAVLGGFIVRAFSGGEKVKVAEQETKRAGIELERVRIEQQVRLKELEYQNADSEHQRKLSLIKYESDQTEKASSRALEQRTKDVDIAEANKKAAHERRMQILERTGDLKPLIEGCMASLKDPEYEKTRQEYRTQLVGEFIGYLEDNDGVWDSGTEICDDDKKKINDLVDLKFPPREMPRELRSLVNLLSDG